MTRKRATLSQLRGRWTGNGSASPPSPATRGASRRTCSVLELLGRTPARHKIHLSHKIHIYLYICINEKISGGQWRTLHGEERGDKSTRPRWRRQLGRRLCRGGFLMMIDDIVLHSVQCKYGALMKISNEGNKHASSNICCFRFGLSFKYFKCGQSSTSQLSNYLRKTNILLLHLVTQAKGLLFRI